MVLLNTLGLLKQRCYCYTKISLILSIISIIISNITRTVSIVSIIVGIISIIIHGSAPLKKTRIPGHVLKTPLYEAPSERTWQGGDGAAKGWKRGANDKSAKGPNG